MVPCGCPGGRPTDAYDRVVLRRVGVPTAWRATIKLLRLGGLTTPSPTDFMSPFLGPATLTLTYKPANSADLRVLPGLVRDCKVFNRGMRCKEP